MRGGSNASMSPKGDRGQASAPVGAVANPERVCAPEGSEETLAAPNFAAALKASDLIAAPLIQGVAEASRSHHRFCAEIAVAATGALLSFEEIPNWEDQARAELAQLNIKINNGPIVLFRIVARLVFRHITKVGQGDGDLAHNTIGASQLTRYAQVMAWTYDKVKAGHSIDAMVGEICSLGGIRKVSELWVDIMEHRRSAAEISVLTESEQPGEPRKAEEDLPRRPLLLLGRILELDGPFNEPKVSITYRDGTVVEAPISADQNSSLVAEWTGSTG